MWWTVALSILKKVPWTTVLLVLLGMVLSFSVAWKIRGCQSDQSLERAMEILHESELETSKLLGDMIDAQKETRDALRKERESLDQKLQKQDQDLSEKLQGFSEDLEKRKAEISAEVTRRFQAESEKVRRDYEELLRNPERVGPVFDHWTDFGVSVPREESGPSDGERWGEPTR